MNEKQVIPSSSLEPDQWALVVFVSSQSSLWSTHSVKTPQMLSVTLHITDKAARHIHHFSLLRIHIQAILFVILEVGDGRVEICTSFSIAENSIGVTSASSGPCFDLVNRRVMLTYNIPSISSCASAVRHHTRCGDKGNKYLSKISCASASHSTERCIW